jgi:hypothetical protein
LAIYLFSAGIWRDSWGMDKYTSHRLVFNKCPWSLGDPVPVGIKDDAGSRLPFGRRAMVDSIYHNLAIDQFIVTVSCYPIAK